MFRESYVPRRCGSAARPLVEALEPRLAPACQATYFQPQQLLVVDCQDVPEFVELSTQFPTLRILFNKRPIQGDPTVFTTTRIEVNARGGNDRVDLTHLFLYRNTTSLLGGAGNDSIVGSEAGDFIQGNDGRDFVWGSVGNDTIEGNNGPDFLWGGRDNDRIYVHDQTRSCPSDIFSEAGWGEGGDDTLYGDLCGLTNDYLDGGFGNDLIYGYGLADTLIGGDDNDTIWGGDGADWAYGGAGNDVLYGEQGGDYLYGDAGNDSVDGGLGSDFMDGGWADHDLVRSDITDWWIAEFEGIWPP